ncbi:hypothetical protein Oweho_3258 [Owenweeksia hongkongensis DSM 17368]|uniref:Uncharacterized protein n=1 Tax=Owenweeksia hongkongensis (strain DSM 17368 / CIP 108786 / JCM 12287 / NRRL B-23963 / UST20020801) TaxID=926562 RepID=G8R4A9_OWEHD|nr:SIR2 family protein [Owenweeksia hongkongensis]AEV34209.1 hypothetical protein Oweho_3258 [Owenweeksia hongkongensis DSM 17368]
MSFEYLTNKRMALDVLSGSLKDGGLIIFIGAGASKDMGLPSWFELVNALRKHQGLVELTGGKTATELHMAADEVRDEVGDEMQFKKILQEVLYEFQLEDFVKKVYDYKLLISLSALLMGSTRGRVTKVFTFNFDSMLQWYLSVFGFTLNVVSALPYKEKSVDVTIFHPHGYVPHPEISHQFSREIILGLEEMDKRLGLGHPWFEVLKVNLRSNLAIFIGLSEDTFFDRALSPVVSDVVNHVGGERPVGFWLFGGDKDEAVKKAMLRKNVIPITLDSYDEIPEYLLEICQKASKM